MTEREFCHWLQGFSEVTNKVPTAEEWKIIQDHLALVFNKVTPNYSLDNVTTTEVAPFRQFRPMMDCNDFSVITTHQGSC